MNELKNDLKKYKALYFANINEKSKKDIDIAVFMWNSKNPIKELIKVFKIAQKYSACFEFYCKNADYPKLKSIKPKVHFLFYPTLTYLQLFEPSSFIRHIEKNAKIEIGNVKTFQNSIRNLYLKPINIEFKTLYHYLEMSLVNIFYLINNSNIYKLEEYMFNFKYINKFFQIECKRIKTGIENFQLYNEIDLLPYKSENELKLVILSKFEEIALKIETYIA